MLSIKIFLLCQFPVFHILLRKLPKLLIAKLSEKKLKFLHKSGEVMQPYAYFRNYGWPLLGSIHT